MEKKTNKISYKNYLIITVIFIITGLLTVYLCKCYSVYNNSKKDIPVIRGTLSEITEEELSHYTLDNPSKLIYMCTASDNNCRKYEKKLKKLVIKKELQDEIVYLNLSNSDIDKFIESFNKTYKYKKHLTKDLPALILFEDGKVVSILQDKDDILSINKTKQFIELNKIGE